MKTATTWHKIAGEWVGVFGPDVRADVQRAKAFNLGDDWPEGVEEVYYHPKGGDPKRFFKDKSAVMGKQIREAEKRADEKLALAKKREEERKAADDKEAQDRKKAAEADRAEAVRLKEAAKAELRNPTTPKPQAESAKIKSRP